MKRRIPTGSIPGSGPHQRRRGLYIVGGVILAVGAALLLSLRDNTPLLSAADLDSALTRWEKNLLPNYDITVHKQSDTLGTEDLKTEVRQGEAHRLFLNGAEIAPNDSYTVSGLFELIARELEMRRAPEPRPGQPTDSLLKGRFHETLGLPLVFKRIAANRQSYVLTVKEITEPAGRIIWKR
jgi:hypothetical protein